MLMKGADPKIMFAELFGREDGYNRGKGGSMHVSDIRLGILGANGIVGAGQVLTVGAGLSSVMSGTDRVTVCFFGDGAANIGSFHEGLNFISAKSLPVIFICINNLYGISMRQDRATNIVNIADRAVGYGVPGVVVDGNDVLEVCSAVKTAVDRARSGGGPTLLEMKTYRHHGHSEGTRPEFRPEDELAYWKSNDPILKLQKHLSEYENVTENELSALEKKAELEMQQAVEFALKSKFPELHVALEDVYTDIVENGR
jgi:pyruvate dehydrogenase E1 component alpha subunit